VGKLPLKAEPQGKRSEGEKTGRKLTVYNPQKGRLETMDPVVSQTNTTKFDTCQTPRAIKMLTDIDGNLVITENGKKKVENQAKCCRRTTGSSSSGLQLIHKKKVMLPRFLSCA